MRFSPSRAATSAIDTSPVSSGISRPALCRRAALGMAAEQLREVTASEALTEKDISCLLGGKEQI